MAMNFLQDVNATWLALMVIILVVVLMDNVTVVLATLDLSVTDAQVITMKMTLQNVSHVDATYLVQVEDPVHALVDHVFVQHLLDTVELSVMNVPLDTTPLVQLAMVKLEFQGAVHQINQISLVIKLFLS